MPRLTKILVILAEIFWVATITSSLVQHGFPTNPVFWVASAIEVSLGILTYNAFKRYLIEKSYRRWHYFILLLTVVGVGGPIAAYYSNIDSLEPAGGTWGVYLLTVNSFYVYRIVRKQPISRTDLPTGRFLTLSKIFHIVFLATVPIMILVVVLLPVFGYVSPPSSIDDRETRLIVEIVFGVMSLLLLLLGFSTSRLAAWVKKTDRSDTFVYFVHGLRSSLFEAVAISGLLLGILGADWYAWLPLFLLAGAAMVFTFPTEKRWLEWKAGRASRQ